MSSLTSPSPRRGRVVVAGTILAVVALFACGARVSIGSIEEEPSDADVPSFVSPSPDGESLDAAPDAIDTDGTIYGVNQNDD